MTVELNLVEHPGPGPGMFLLPGLTSNAHCFDGLVAAGLDLRCWALDLRGRGLSPQPEQGYRLEDHAGDVLALMDRLGLAATTLVGHSFGGLLSLFMAARFPQRVQRLVLLDAAVGISNPLTYELIRPSLGRLGRSYPSFDSFLAEMRAAPTMIDDWDPWMETYYRADVGPGPGTGVICRTRPDTVAQVVAGLQGISWEELAAQVSQPTLLIRGRDGYGRGNPALVSPQQVESTRKAIPQLRTLEVAGHHFSMLYAQGAPAIAQALRLEVL